jgi:hypothetical protein
MPAVHPGLKPQTSHAAVTVSPLNRNLKWSHNLHKLAQRWIMQIEFVDQDLEQGNGVVRFPVVVDGEIHYFGIPEAHIQHLHFKDDDVLAAATHLRTEIETIIARKIQAGDFRMVFDKRYIFL